MHFGKATFETLNRLRRERNFRDEHNRAASALERNGDFVQRESLFRIQLQICCRDKLLVRVWVALDRFFAQLDQAALDERAQRLVIERSFAQQFRSRHWLLQSDNGVEEFSLTRCALPQI